MSNECKLFCQGCGIPAPNGGPSCDICKADTWKSFARPNTPGTPNLLLRIEELERRLKRLEEGS